MKAETDPITDDEWLLRRVHYKKFTGDTAKIVEASAFRPRDDRSDDPDTSGISLFREACLSEPIAILALLVPEKREENGIVRISVSSIRGLGLTVVSEKDDDIPGHVVIPELCSSAYSQSKLAVRALTVSLALLASEEGNVVLIPKRIADAPAND